MIQVMTSEMVRIAAARAPWGPIQVAVSGRGLVGLAVLAPPDRFAADVARRIGREVAPGSTPLLDRAVAAIESFVAGEPAALQALPIDLVVRSAWDEAVLGAVRHIPWGQVSSYGGVATAIGRRSAARAVGGSVGRNPIGLAIPCHRVIAGDGSIGGYGGDWFGTREQLLEIKRELLAIEGIRLPPAD